MSYTDHYNSFFDFFDSDFLQFIIYKLMSKEGKEERNKDRQKERMNEQMNKRKERKKVYLRKVSNRRKGVGKLNAK